ncbi:hypothetical protein R6Q59_017836 [Mikania micrantha]
MESLQPPKRPLPPPLPATMTVTAATMMKTKIVINTPTNNFLTGYMAHEFQTNGTLLGQKLDFAQAGTPEIGKIRPVLEMRTPMNRNERDKEVTSLIMMKSNSGVHIPSIMNRTHHARWIHM